MWPQGSNAVSALASMQMPHSKAEPLVAASFGGASASSAEAQPRLSLPASAGDSFPRVRPVLVRLRRLRPSQGSMAAFDAFAVCPLAAALAAGPDGVAPSPPATSSMGATVSTGPAASTEPPMSGIKGAALAAWQEPSIGFNSAAATRCTLLLQDPSLLSGRRRPKGSSFPPRRDPGAGSAVLASIFQHAARSSLSETSSSLMGPLPAPSAADWSGESATTPASMAPSWPYSRRVERRKRD
mmetsp:Transcript_108367/g.305582  ORF Transcript_108367/g.305582 Transcript_108367/m.305582 type:complete len:241 (+) Transcript_108367:198-920(+)